jgi:hypothetical protein
MSLIIRYVQDLAIDSEENLIVAASALKGTHRAFVCVFALLPDLQPSGIPGYRYFARYNVSLPAASGIAFSLVFAPRFGMLAVTGTLQRVATTICRVPLEGAEEGEDGLNLTMEQ